MSNSVAVWADRTWCPLDMVEEYNFKSDDYRVADLSSEEFERMDYDVTFIDSIINGER